MREMSKQVGSVLVNGLLLIGLVGMLIAYLVVVSDLPSRVYTPAQWEYLRYNYARSITQAAPTWNILLPSGEVEPPILAGWETYVRATLAARYEEQEGVSVTVYDLDFHSEYHLAYPGPAVTATIELFFPFPSNLETLHEVRFLVDGAEPPEARYTVGGIQWQTEMEVGEEHQITISYQADGANSFTYGLNRDRRSDVLDVTITVLGLTGSEVSKDSLPSTASTVDDSGETFAWNYTGLVANRDIRLDLPTRLGFAQRVAQLQDDFRALAGLAPFLVGLFLASLAGMLRLSGMRLRVEVYLLAGCGLALFYPLLTFLGGLVDVILAAVVALLLVSSLLLVFLGLTAGWRQTWWRAGWLLVIFLGIFSLGMLTPWRGLLLTGGGLLLVGTLMLLYALRPAVPEPEPAPIPPPAEVEPRAYCYCPHCGRALADDYDFCPGCGHDARRFRRCASCGREQFVPAELEPAYCLRCGQPLSD